MKHEASRGEWPQRDARRASAAIANPAANATYVMASERLGKCVSNPGVKRFGTTW